MRLIRYHVAYYKNTNKKPSPRGEGHRLKSSNHPLSSVPGVTLVGGWQWGQAL